MSNNGPVLFWPAVVICFGVVVFALVFLDDGRKDRQRLARIEREEDFRRKFTELFGAKPPRNDTERAWLEPQIVSCLKQTGGVSDYATASSLTRYIEMKQLALQAGYSLERLAAIDARIRQQTCEPITA